MRNATILLLALAALVAISFKAGHQLAAQEHKTKLLLIESATKVAGTKTQEQVDAIEKNWKKKLDDANSAAAAAESVVVERRVYVKAANNNCTMRTPASTGLDDAVSVARFEIDRAVIARVTAITEDYETRWRVCAATVNSFIDREKLLQQNSSRR